MLIRRKRTFILEVGKSKYAESKQNPNAGKKLQTESKKQAGSTQVRLLKNTTDATYKTKDRHACKWIHVQSGGGLSQGNNIQEVKFGTRHTRYKLIK